MLLPLTWLVACGPAPDPEPIPEPLLEEELAAWSAYEAATIAVEGRVLGADGAPLAGAEVEIDGTLVTTDDDGRFVFADRPRRNAVLRVEATGLRAHVAGLQLVKPVGTERVVVPDVRLDAAPEGTTRFLFAGDMALGRRYLDPDESTPRGRMPPVDPEATIRTDHAASDSVDVVSGMVPLFASADVRVVNLETPVTDDPDTPHETKQWAFFTLPGSLSALHELGVAFVSLGNNHVYDYLRQGVVDTLRNLDAAGIGHAGAGLDPDSAFVPWRFESEGVPYTFVSATTIAGEGRVEPEFVADEDQGGAADLRDTSRLLGVLGAERGAGRVPIALFHMGNEYSRAPNDYAIDRADTAIEHGAALVIGHHPHTTQGFSLRQDRLVAWSLGNFAFDQDRLETFAGYTVLADLAGDTLGDVHVVPHVIDAYRPVLAVGDLADRVIVDAGAMSTPELTVVPDGLHGRVVAPGPDAVRTLEVEVRIGEDGRGHFDLRAELVPGEGVVGVEAISGADRWWLGRDQLLFGGFEDEDVDGDLLEAEPWYRGASSRVCLTGARRGAAGLCLYRTERSIQPAAVAFRYRIRVPGDAENTPNKDLTAFFWAKGDNAGETLLYARAYASFGDREFGDQDLAVLQGDFDWTPVTVPLDLPADDPAALDPWADNARAVRLFVASYAPYVGAGRLALDDLAVVAWEVGPHTAPRPQATRAPSSAAFLRVEGEPGTTATVTVRVAAARSGDTTTDAR